MVSFLFKLILILYFIQFQPKDLTDDIKTFLIHLRGDEKTKSKSIAKSKFYFKLIKKEITIKTKDNTTKFKLRCPRYLYTAYVEDPKKAEKIKSAIPSTIVKVELGDKKGKKKEEKKTTGKKAPKN